MSWLHINMFRFTFAVVLQLCALAAFGQDYFVSMDVEFEWSWLVQSAIFLDSYVWFTLNVLQVISETEDAGGKTHLVHWNLRFPAH